MALGRLRTTLLDKGRSDALILSQNTVESPYKVAWASLISRHKERLEGRWVHCLCTGDLYLLMERCLPQVESFQNGSSTLKRIILGPSKIMPQKHDIPGGFFFLLCVFRPTYGISGIAYPNHSTLKLFGRIHGRKISMHKLSIAIFNLSLH